MFENKTLEVLHDGLLQNINDSYDKIKGSFPYDLTRTVAIEHEKMYQTLDKIVSSMQIENLTGEELDTYIYQRTSIQRKPATHSIGYVEVTGNGVVNVGDLFETSGGVQFKAVEQVTIVDKGAVKVESLLTGSEQNIPANQIKVIPITLPGITSVNNTGPTHDGFDEEDDNSLRERYYEKVRMPGTSGNIYHYKQWAKSVTGVGDAKVFPLWQGNNTVKVVIVDQKKQPATEQLVNEVQQYIDPNCTGKGEGQAPIGAFCTVVSATGKTIDLQVEVILTGDLKEEVVKQKLEKNIQSYFEEVAFVDNAYVSYAKMGAIVLSTEGIKDYHFLQVNLGTDNIDLGEEEVPVVGGITFV